MEWVLSFRMGEAFREDRGLCARGDETCGMRVVLEDCLKLGKAEGVDCDGGFDVWAVKAFLVAATPPALVAGSDVSSCPLREWYSVVLSLLAMLITRFCYSNSG